MKILVRAAFVEIEMFKLHFETPADQLAKVDASLNIKVIKLISPENKEMTGVISRVQDLPRDTKSRCTASCKGTCRTCCSRQTACTGKGRRRTAMTMHASTW